MNFFKKQTIKRLYALLLLVVFVSSLLIKPSHIFFSDHKHEKEVIHIQNEISFVEVDFEYCPILDFEFCTFIQNNITDLPHVNFRICSKRTFQTNDLILTETGYLFQLRAPPAFS